MDVVSLQKFEKTLKDWYGLHRRDLPWRRTKDPYAIWVSEIMLQQTQVERVKEYYARFMKRFPNIGDLANAKWEDVLECWRGLGYYRRARNMHKAAQVIVKDFGGKFPRFYDDLRKLPGVGSYTASAIASFAFGEKVPALDTNISRVFERIFGDAWEMLKPVERFEFAQKYIGGMKSRDFNYALMDLGSLVCNARQPKCGECAFQKVCSFAKANADAEYKLPRAAAGLAFADKGGYWGGKLKAERNAVKVAAGVLIHNGKVLIAKRPKGKPLAGLWEFPGGKVEYRENERTCLKREFIEELGVEVAVRPSFYKTLTEHEGTLISLSFHRCSLLLGEVRSLEGQEFKWVEAKDLNDYEFPSANDEVVTILQEKKAMFYSS